MGEAIASLGVEIASDQRDKVVTIVDDLTGVTAGFLTKVSASLDPSRPIPADEAVARLAKLAEQVQPRGFATGERYDLVVASCVLCQLHVATCNETLRRFDLRYPGELATFSQSPNWVRAMYSLARRMESAFIDGLVGLTAPGGRIYLSDTIQGGFLHLTPEQDWLSDGVYRMTRTLRLADELDHRFQILHEGRWHWVIPPTRGTGRGGPVLQRSGDGPGADSCRNTQELRLEGVEPAGSRTCDRLIREGFHLKKMLNLASCIL